MPEAMQKVWQEERQPERDRQNQTRPRDRAGGSAALLRRVRRFRGDYSRKDLAIKRGQVSALGKSPAEGRDSSRLRTKKLRVSPSQVGVGAETKKGSEELKKKKKGPKKTTSPLVEFDAGAHGQGGTRPPKPDPPRAHAISRHLPGTHVFVPTSDEIRK